MKRRSWWSAIAAAVAMVLVVADPAEIHAQRLASAPSANAEPRLAVLLVVDQFRADYLDWYGAQWSQGLRRLMSGAVFPRATLPYAVSKTCAGHSTIGTGAYPSSHGMIDNEWYDTATRAFVSCTLDPTAESIAFGGARGSEHHSARFLGAPTIGDELLRQVPASRVVSIGLKARAAISLGGHGGPNATIVWEEDSGTWATSSAFASAPWPDIDAFVRAHPVARARGGTWQRQLPIASYRFDDRARGEPPASAVFPHLIDAPLGASFAAVWDASPLSDAYLGDMASGLANSMKLGQQGTDLLTIGFASLDYVGHIYGPRSHEVQDTLARLDVTIGRLLSTLDRTVGAGQYVVALTSDHGVALLPEQAGDVTGAQGGRVNLNTVGLAADIAISAQFGRGPYVASVSGTYIHFLPGVLNRLRASPAAMAAVEAGVRGVGGIERVYWSQDLAAKSPTDDPILTALRRSYFAGRSGDLAFLPRPNWVVASAGTNHGSAQPYDLQVPVLFAGWGIKAGRYTTAASPIDVAPTLAALLHIAMPRADGRVLGDALVR
ncbi:MAG: alkaline phosphatase family protein [Acidobacteriota bacterium]